jgi:hypothetical protein
MTSTLFEDVPAVILIIIFILAISDPTYWNLDWKALAMLLIISIISLAGTIVSKLLQEWWGKLLSILAGIIGFIYFFWIMAEIFWPGLIGSGAMGAGGILDIFSGD